MLFYTLRSASGQLEAWKLRMVTSKRLVCSRRSRLGKLAARHNASGVNQLLAEGVV
jgi:hypothetical protein